jgi:hypothetical protein
LLQSAFAEKPRDRTLALRHPFTTDILVKLPLLERFVLWGGSFPDELLRALLDRCPRLKLLDATDCLPVDWEVGTTY